MMTVTAPAPGIWDIKRPDSVRDHVIDTLLAKMRAGELPVGSLLPPEAVLCQHLGVSRVALREAIKQLEILGFVEVARGNGTFVRCPDFSCLERIIAHLGKTQDISLKEFHDLRTLYELEAVSEAAAHAEPEVVARLRAVLDEAEAHVDDEYGYVDLDLAFHQTLIEACSNRLLQLFVAPLSHYLRNSRYLSYQGADAALRTIASHRKIVDAVARGSVADARSEMSAHLRQTAEELGISVE